MAEQPTYLRVADQLRQRITAQEWAVGERLPARAQLAEEYGVGRNVMQRAQEALISQGLLEGHSGSGTYVAQQRERLRMVRSLAREASGGSPFRADMAALGKRGSWESRTEAKVPAPADIAGRLGIAEGALCVRTAYEFLADGKPAQLSTSWEPYEITEGTIIVLPEGGPHAGKGVVDRMAEIGLTVSHSVELPDPRRASAEEITLLGLQREALVTHITRTYYADDGRPVETADIIVPAATCEIVYEVPLNR